MHNVVHVMHEEMAGNSNTLIVYRPEICLVDVLGNLKPLHV